MAITETPKEAARRLSAKHLALGFKPEGLFEWKNEKDEIILWTIRLKNPITQKKWIRPMHLNGNGYDLSEPKLEGKKPIYNLPEILRRLSEIIYIVEGPRPVCMGRK